MKRTTLVALGALLLLATTGCGSRRPPTQTYRVPPRIDLTQHETIGIVDFEAASNKDLGTLATRRFTESARRDQGLVRMVGFGSKSEALRSGAERGVRTLLVGKLTLSNAKPNVRIDSSLRSGSVASLVNATLEVEMIETATGASIWSATARAQDSLGQVSLMGGGDVAFGANDSEQVYAGLIDNLIEQATRDFHESWERR